MALVTGTVQDLGYDGMEGTLWARPARFRSDGQVVYAPERKPFKITGGVVSAELAPGPAVLELQVGSHARGTFEVVIPDADTTLADLLGTVFAWEPAQVSLFVAEREAAELAKVEAVAAAGTATSAAQQAGQDRSHVDQVRTELDEAFDESTAGNVLPPRLTETALNATYEPVGAARTINGVVPGPDGDVTIPVGDPDAVIGVGVGRVIATTDRNYPAADGDLLIYVDLPILFTDFASATIGASPDGWSVPWGTRPLATIVEDPAATASRSLRIPGVGARHAHKWDEADALRNAEQEIVFCWRTDSATAAPRAVLRGSGAAGTENGYWLGRNAINAGIGRYTDGASGTLINNPAPFEVGPWFITRARVNADTASVKTWLASAPEPTAWTSTATDASPVLADGFVGLMNFETDAPIFINWVGVGFNGATAPKIGGQ